jgi:hypothetical protein
MKMGRLAGTPLWRGFLSLGTFLSLRSYRSEGVTPQRLPGVPLKFFLISSLILSGMAIAPASAQTTDNPEIAACKATGILALKEKSPAVRDLILDMDTMVVSKAATEIEGIPIRTVIMGDVYLEKKVTGKAQHFLCLIGEKGKVLLTFFVAP